MSTRVAVCRKCQDHDCLEDFLRRKTGARVDIVRCQKICNGPVAGLEIDDANAQRLHNWRGSSTEPEA